MEKLTNAEATVSFEDVQDLSQPLAQSTELAEALDFSYFGGESGVNVNYEISSEVSAPYRININEGEQEKDANAVADGSKLVTSGSVRTLTYKTLFRRMARVNEIDYNLIQTGGNKFIREIVITLANGTDASILDNISQYYSVKGAANTKITVENESTPTVKIYVSGSAKKVVAAESVLFGGVGARALAYDRNWGIFNIKPTTKLMDSYDLEFAMDASNGEVGTGL